MARLQEGDKAPPFSLVGDDGAKVSLAGFTKKRFVIYFYPADDTPGCTKEACQFNDLLRDYANLEVSVVGISPDDAASHQRFRGRYGLNLVLASDPTHQVMEAYGAWGEKTLYGRKSVGVIRSTFVVGPDARIEKAFYAVRADGHPARVLAELRKLVEI